MKATLFKEVSYSLSKLIEDIDMGEIGLPDIQRPFVWTPAKVRDLFDSMYKGFPVGYLLFWANGAGNGHRQIGSEAKQKVARLLIVDGQQRLTSLYSVLKSRPVVTQDYETQYIQIAFRPTDQTFEVADAAIRKDPDFIANISDMWSQHAGSYGFIKEYVSKLRQHRGIMPEEEAKIAGAIDQVYDLRNYPFTALELSPTVSEESVAEVFVRINSKGVTLKQADFILTLMSVFWDEGRAQLEQFCRESRIPSFGKPSPFNHFLHPEPDELLRASIGLGFRRARLKHVYSILRGKDLETEKFSEQFRVQQFATLQEAQGAVVDLTNWHEFLKSLVSAGYRSSGMVTSTTAVIYAYVMYLLGKRDFGVDSWELRNVTARWFFMVTLTGRYTGSPETQMEADLLRLRPVKDAQGFVRALDSIIADTFTEDYWNITLPNDLATSAARSPSLFAYYASLNLLGATALFSRLRVAELLDPALRAKKSPVETHHLFPRAYLETIGIKEKVEVNQLANFAWVEWDDNISISDDPPPTYWPAYASRYSPAELAHTMKWHALPKDWATMRYDNFLTERRKLMAKVVREGFDYLSDRAPSATTQEEELAMAAIVAGPPIPTSPAGEAAPDDAPADSHDEELSERKQLQLKFWTTFKDYMEKSNSPVKCQTPGPKYWMHHPLGKSGIYLASQISAWNSISNDRTPELSVSLVIRTDRALEQFAALRQRKSEVEAALGFTLRWEDSDARKKSRYVYTQRNADFFNEQLWPEQQLWLKDTLEQFRTVFGLFINGI